MQVEPETVHRFRRIVENVAYGHVGREVARTRSAGVVHHHDTTRSATGIAFAEADPGPIAAGRDEGGVGEIQRGHVEVIDRLDVSTLRENLEIGRASCREGGAG